MIEKRFTPKLKFRRKFYWDGFKVSGKEFYKRWEEKYNREYFCWYVRINDNRDIEIILQDELMHQIRNDIDQEILRKLKEFADEM